MDIDGVNEEENSRRVQVRFVTKLKPPMTVPPLPIAIPSNLTRLGLSTLVNNLIQNGNPDWNTQPFDFLIDGELVRMSLDKFLLAKSISAVTSHYLFIHLFNFLFFLETNKLILIFGLLLQEKILEIEYIKAVAPRKEEEPSLHDDWVSSVDGSDPRYALVVKTDMSIKDIIEKYDF